MKLINIPSALSITGKDIQILLKERGTLIYLFIVPILFVLGFSSTGGMEKDPQEEVITLPVVNLDTGVDSMDLLDTLNQGGAIKYEIIEEVVAGKQLENGKINRVLTIPENYSTDLESGNHVTLRLVNGPDASPTKTEAVYRVVSGITADLSLKIQLISSFSQMADMQVGFSPEQRAFTKEIIIEQAQSQFDRAKTEPLVALEESWPDYLLEQGEQEIQPVNLFVPGFTVLFIFLTAQTTANSIYIEKKVGSFRRLLAAPISKITILIGKMVPNFITGLAQIILLFGAGIYLLPLLGIDQMNMGKDPLALILVCLILLLCSTSLGVLIAAIARTEGQISGLSAVILWVFGFAGMWFLQMPLTPFFESIARLMPHYWANMTFLDLFARGQGLADITTNLLVLLGFTVLFFIIGVWCFDFD